MSNSWLPYVTRKQGTSYWISNEDDGSTSEDTTSGVLQLIPQSMPEPNKRASFLGARVRSLLALPDIPVWGTGIESHQYVEKCKFLHKFPWVSNSRESEKVLESETDQRELDLTRGVQILSGSVAYTIQSNITAVKWIQEDPNKPVTAFQTVESLEFAAAQLHLLRQMPNWFPTRESFEDCVGTPLKLLLSGSEGTPSNLSLDDRGELRDSKVCFFSSIDHDKLSTDYAGNHGELEYDMRRALQSSPYKHIVSKVSVPSVSAMDKQQSSWAAHGIPASELWGFLGIPLLSMDLHTIAVLAMANAADVQTAKQVVSLISLARLCQLLLEPGNTGISDRFHKEATGLYRQENQSWPPSLPFKLSNNLSTMDDHKKEVNPATAWAEANYGNEVGDAASERVSAMKIEESALAMQRLQEILTNITGDSTNPAWRRDPESALRGALDAWIPFLEYSVALLQTLDCAARGVISIPAPFSTKIVEASSTVSVMQHTTELCKALSLPADINDVATSPSWAFLRTNGPYNLLLHNREKRKIV